MQRTQSDRPRLRSRASAVLFPLTIALGVLACAVGRSGREDVPRQGWWEGDGIVVPHDRFPADCKLCHTGDDWNTIRADFAFDHEQETGVALEGPHARAGCLRCHNDRGPVAIFAAKGCAGCHEDVHLGQMGSGCTDCHEGAKESWEPNAEVLRHSRTRFPLVGAHVAAACWRCHPGSEVGNFSRTEVECVACHTNDLARALVPDHQALGFTDDCERCHIPTTWTGAGFNHSAFPLTGAHRTLACEVCHAGGVYTGIPTDCYGCHADDYQRVRDPNHVALGFPTDCARCHSTSSWEGARFDHTGIVSGCVQCHQADYDHTSDPNHAAENFPTTCELCHSTNSWTPAGFNHAGIISGCIECHLADYQGTTDPDHEAMNFPTSCEQCHGTRSWTPAGFNHAGITSGCVECHLADYQGTTDPDHEAANIPTTCEQCHGTRSWTPANFNHAGITSGCVECHLSDYKQTRDPNHAAAGFPTTCELCHGTRAWEPANFDHSFPIQSGRHSSLDCADCHPNPRNYNVFTCISCHAHNQTEMNHEHDRVPGYVYESGACLSCHPNGSR